MPSGVDLLATNLERYCRCSAVKFRLASTYSAIRKGVSRREPDLGSRAPAASRPFYENDARSYEPEYHSRPTRPANTEFYKQRGRLGALKLRSRGPRYANTDDRDGQDRPGKESKARFNDRDTKQSDVDLPDQPSRHRQGYDSHTAQQADTQRYIQSLRQRAELRGPETEADSPAPRGYAQLKAAERRAELTESERRIKEQRQARLPLHIEYTTPASEFLYGTSVIQAALNSDRRKIYKLYVGSSDGRTVVARDDAMIKLARLRNVEVEILRDYKIRLLDMMSKNRPHNGYVLEASPIAKPPVEYLHPVEKPAGDLSVRRTFPFLPARQSAEEAEINGTDYEVVYGYGSKVPRYPFLLMLDGVVDTGNVGGILRSAFFLGVDAVVVSTRIASLTTAALKAAAGAAESMTILSVHNTTKFVRDSQANGWRFFASVAPTSEIHGKPSRHSVPHYGANNLGAPLMESPCVLMLGAESTGLPDDLVRKADCKISIEGDRSGQAGVDSLNVSVAAGILAASFLKTPDVLPKSSRDIDTQNGSTGEEQVIQTKESLW